MDDREYKPMTYQEADELARKECERMGKDIYIYRLRNGRFRITSNQRSIPFDASIHSTISKA